jgi:DNA-binding NtrC family response regulator
MTRIDSDRTRPDLLLVDDEEGVRITLSMAFDLKGFNVTSSATVPEALRLMCQQTFDVLIALTSAASQPLQSVRHVPQA